MSQKQSPVRRLRALAINLALIAAIFASVQWVKARSLVQGDAPPLTAQPVGTAPDAPVIDLTQFRGRPVLVHFWATWCPVCRLGEHSIDRIAADHPVIGVALQSGDDRELMQYLRAEGLTYPTVSDPDGTIASRWGVSGVPSSFILDGSGAIRFARVGYTTGWGLRTRLWLAGLLDGNRS